MDWDPNQYLRFGEQRTRVVRDLIARLQRHLDAERVRRIADLGCGPGNSTAVLAETWPEAEIVGLDQSEAMLASARAAHASHPKLHFETAEITAWAKEAGPPYDLVFSNSALQWIPGHDALLPELLRRVRPGGALAAQIPAETDAPACSLPRALADAAHWRSAFAGTRVRQWSSESLARYYEALAPHAAGLDLWETEYLLIMPGAEAILEWYRGSGLRPYLEALPEEASRARFQQDYLAGLRTAYPPQARGEVLFPFRRRFLVARAG